MRLAGLGTDLGLGLSRGLEHLKGLLLRILPQVVIHLQEPNRDDVFEAVVRVTRTRGGVGFDGSQVVGRGGGVDGTDLSAKGGEVGRWGGGGESVSSRKGGGRES